MATHTCQHSTQESRQEDLEFSYSQLYSEFGNSLGYTIPWAIQYPVASIKMGSGAVAKLLEHLPSMDKAWSPSPALYTQGVMYTYNLSTGEVEAGGSRSRPSPTK